MTLEKALEYTAKSVATNNQMILLTTDEWFYGPDGNLYRAVYGVMKDLEHGYAFGPGQELSIPRKQAISIFKCNKVPVGNGIYRCK